MLYSIFLLTTFIVTIAMPNLLVAVISDTYARVSETMAATLAQARARRIVELETTYGFLRPTMDSSREFLMWLNPDAQTDAKETWQGQAQLADLTSRMQALIEQSSNDMLENLNSTIGREAASTNSRLEGVEAQVEQSLSMLKRLVSSQELTESLGLLRRINSSLSQYGSESSL